MKKYLAIIIAIAFSSICLAQFNSNFYYKDVYSKQNNFDSLIRSELQNNLTESYYVITTPLIGATTSWAPQFIQLWNRLKKTQNDIVMLCYTNGGLRKKDMPLFFHKLFKLSDEEIKKIKYIYNDDLYEIVSEKRNLVRLQYYFRRNLYYNEGGKWHDVRGVVLPDEKIKIEQTGKIKLTGIDSLMLFERDALFPFKKDHLLLLADATNEIFDLNTQTGELKSVLLLSNIFTATDLYCKYFAHDTAACNLAKREEYYYKNINRKVIEVESLKHENGKLILSVSIQTVERDNADYNFKNDEGKKSKIKAGEATLNLHAFIMYYDLATKQFEIYKLNEIPETKERSPYIMDANGLYLIGDTIITTTHSWHKKGDNSLSIVKLIPKKREYYPVEGISPKNKVSGLLQDYYSKNFFYRFNDTDYFSANYSGDIYLVGRDKVQSTFYGNGSKPYSVQKYATFFEDTVTANVNFLFHDIKPILNNKYLLAYCKYKGHPIFELKNRMLKTVDIIDAKKIKGLERYLTSKYREDILINEDKVYYKSIENDEMYLNVFSIIEQ